jgi:NADH dehydrogenase (ubiquinone) 1 alpha subcomplex subunit 9
LALLVNAPRRYYQLQRVHVFDKGGRNTYSGINATLFGGSSNLGSVLGSMLTSIGSTVVYPYRSNGTLFDTKFREVKVTADLGHKAYVKLNDMSSLGDIRHVIRDQNVVINCTGSRIFYQTEKEFEDANIHVPVAIAKVAKENPNVKRLIHVSAAGADPNSQSMRLRTKWIGEQMVKEIYPEATIIRPTYMFNPLDLNPSIASKWGMQMKMFNRMNFLVEGWNGKCQPTFVNDVALAMYNCIKSEETIGKTYDLGGPHTYTYEQMYEHFFHLTEIKPYSVTVKPEMAYRYKQYHWAQSVYKKLFKIWLNPEFMTQEAQDLVVNPNNLGYEALGVKPISFGHKAHELVQEITWLYGTHDVTKRESENQ